MFLVFRMKTVLLQTNQPNPYEFCTLAYATALGKHAHTNQKLRV